MVLIVALLLGWFLLSVPLGIVVGNILRGPRVLPAVGVGFAGYENAPGASRPGLAA